MLFKGTFFTYNSVMNLDVNMRPPCETVVRLVLPAFRSLVAKELVEEYGFSQVDAAKELGTTQAAVSQYLGSKRGVKQLKQIESSPSIKLVVSRVASGIAKSELATIDTIGIFCDLCEALRKREVVCDLHRTSAGLPENCHVCE